jgi:SAM-dependent methyltransferase
MTPVPTPPGDERFEERDAVFFPRDGVVKHQSEDYDPRSFELLRRMQREHFWYRGRHRFVRAAVVRCLEDLHLRPGALSAMDLGGGCGGWVNGLHERGPRFRELALGDSSIDALRQAREVIPESIRLYNVSLYDLPWDRRWDIVFLLDVLEHLEDDTEALRQVVRALKPGGLVFATVPALARFWSRNDDLAGHRRRYSRADMSRLGARAGLEVLDTRYFMFLLSPALWTSRRIFARRAGREREEAHDVLERTHRVPAAPWNEALAAVFAAETPLGLHCRFPWGTSVLSVYRLHSA